MVSSCKLSRFGTDSLSDSYLYRSIVWALQYATLTKPEIAYSVNKVFQFMENLLETHWKAVKRILRYFKGTLSYGLELKPASSAAQFSLVAYSDVDWASDPHYCRSTSGYCIYFGPNLVSWCSKKQNLVAKSTAEAEHSSMAHATSELLWIQSLLQELNISFSKPCLYFDNPVLHARTKNMEFDIHFARKKVVLILWLKLMFLQLINLQMHLQSLYLPLCLLLQGLNSMCAHFLPLLEFVGGY